MASTHSRVDSDRFKTIAIVTLVTVVTGAVTGLDWLSRPMAVADTAPVQAGAAPDSGPVDIGFAQDMSLHHEQALTMANLALAKGSPRVRMLAQGIVNQQLKEIGYMQGWLMLWQAPGIAADDQMRWMRDAYARSGSRDLAYEQFIDSCAKGRGMPGLASPDQLDALAASGSPEDFDAMFLALMVRHHQGAVVMARFAAEHAELALVRGFATSIAAEQQQEMAQMLKWLKA